jgi:hypothetical protein
MTDKLRTIPVSELQPGDSFQVSPGRIDFVTTRRPTSTGGVLLFTIDSIYADDRAHGLWGSDATALVTVGYTNRRAKRLRAKMRRRERFAAAA